MNASQTPPERPACESFELAISAMLDGELRGTEKQQLGEHLLQCASCRQTVREFESINGSVMQLGQPASVTAAERELDQGTQTAGQRFRPRTAIRFVLGVVAAVTAASVLFLILNRPDSINEDVGSVAEQFVKPAQELRLISLEQEQDQILRLKTLELQLRQLRLETNGIEDANDQFAMTMKIDGMINRVLEKQFYNAIESGR